MSQSSFSFPILDNDELLPCLSEMEVSLDANQLAKPSYEVVRCVFEQIVIMLTGVTREELTQPVFTAMDAFEYPELHDESIPTNNFFRLLSKLMVASGVKDFSWRDVFKPESAKLRRNLSAIINFAKFREEKALAFQELQGQLDGMVDNTRALEEEYARNVSELQAMQARRAQQAAEVSQVEAQEAEITAKNTQLNKQAAVLQNEVRQLKAHANALADTASQAKLDLAAAKQETASLSDQIVQSPEKHRQAIAELAAVCDAKRTYCAQLSSQMMDNDRKLEMVVKFEKEALRCSKLLEELDTVVAKKKDVSQQVKDLKQSIAVHERVLAEVSNTGATYKRQQASVMEKFQRLEHQAALKLEAAVSYVEEALKSKEAVEAENAAAAAKAAEDEAVIRCIRERMQDLQASHDSTVRNVLDKYAMLRQTVGEHNRGLQQLLKSSSRDPSLSSGPDLMQVA